MKKVYLVITLSSILLILSMYGRAQKIPKLKDPWPTPSRKYSMYIPSGIFSRDTLVVDGIKFDIVVNNKQVVYVGTIDKNFMIGGKKYVGLALSDFKFKEGIKLYLGWGHYLKISDEWYALFDFNKLTDSSKVLSVFKYQF